MRLHVFLVLLLSGCPSPGLFTGLTGVKSQQGYTLNTVQKCIDAKRAVEIADIALPIYFQQLEDAGYIKDRKVIEETKFAVCLIQKPEPCSQGGVTLGPLGPKLPGEKYPLAARKRGCASSSTAWNAKEWPPVCRKEWPDEPHCATEDKVSEVGWEAHYLHELYNMAVLRWTNVYKPNYQHEIYQEIGKKVKAFVLDIVK